MPPGTNLPGLHTIAREYGVSFSTAASTLHLLAEEGLIRCRRGCAARILPPKTAPQHWRIAVSIDDMVETYSDFPYQGGTTIWSLHQFVLLRLLADRNSALNVSGPDWKRHIGDIDGIVLLRPEHVEETLAQIGKTGIPYVVITTRRHPEVKFNCVDTDFLPGVSQAAIRLLCCGVKTIFTALYTAIPNVHYKGRFSSFFTTLHDQNFPSEAIHCWPVLGGIDGSLLPEAIREIVIPALKKAPRPIGILSCSDIQSYGLIEAAKAAGLTLKKDCFIIGASGLPESAVRTPALTVISPSLEKLANTGIEMLYRMLNNHCNELPGVTCSAKLITRNT